MVEAGASGRGIVMCNYSLMAANPRIALGEDVPEAATTESWMSRGLIPWEERVFADDTGGVILGTWPPRTYSCDFCKRDFRSAQALGGHMNVHRRDRALLRQSSSTHQGPPNYHQRWSSPSFVRQEIPGHFQFPAFNSNFEENPLLQAVTPNPTIISSSQVLPSSSTMPATPLINNSHITYDPIQRRRGHEICLPSRILPISPYSQPYEHAFPTKSPPVSNSVTINNPNNHHPISGFDRHHGGFASSMAGSAAVLRKLQQARAFQPCFPVSSLKKQIEHDIIINNSQHDEAISLDEEHESIDDGLDLELRLGQTKF